MHKFEGIKALDDYIIKQNESKNIPTELGDVDSLFYDLDKDVSYQILQRLYENHKQYVETNNKTNHTKEEEIKMEEEPETKNHDSEKESTTLVSKGKRLQMDLELEFDDIDGDDLPSMDNLALKR
mgnify:CR=1 FL=1